MSIFLLQTSIQTVYLRRLPFWLSERQAEKSLRISTRYHPLKTVTNERKVRNTLRVAANVLVN